MRAVTKPPRQAVYAAPKADWLWLRSEQRKLHERSFRGPGYVFEKLWGLVTDPRNLRLALARVARNRGHRSPGVQGAPWSPKVRS